MNPIEDLRDHVRVAYPEASCQITPPLREDGVWSLDIDLGDSQLTIEWSALSGFGISSVGRENFGEGPDEVAASLQDTKIRIDQLLTGRERTSPPAPVLLSRLRQQRGITQRDLAARLGVRQATISGMERRDDIQLSTLRRIIEALGGALDVFAVFTDACYRIDYSSLVQDGARPCSDENRRLATIDYEHAFEGLRQSGVLPKAQSLAKKIRERQLIIAVPS